MHAQSDIGLIGLAVMGQNLALNIADHGFPISVFNRTYAKTQAFINERSQHTKGSLKGFESLKDFVLSLKKPRKIVLLVQAGSGTDAVIEELKPLLDKEDIIIDCGNAHWEDTMRRDKALTALGLNFVGSGISGGEEGARFGPSLMAGCSEKSWIAIKDIWTAVSAKVDNEACAARVGEDGSGHYVKMVHNGIEYGDMQMICEAYHFMRDVLKLSNVEMSSIFKKWNQGKLNSYLIEITGDILQQQDPHTKQSFVDIVLDAAGQKGTGKWTSVSALNFGAPTPTIAEAVFARCMSAIKEERVAASKMLNGPSLEKPNTNNQPLIDAVEDALYCSKICSYAQGFQLLQYAASEYNWHLDFSVLGKIWRGGCIIRAGFLKHIHTAFKQNSNLANLLLDPFFKKEIESSQHNWRMIIALGAQLGIPLPTFSSALSYFDSYRSANLPQNLLQAQRDYFGAHTYERIDKLRGQHFHLDWLSKDRPEIKI